jgi:hypothetical protein
MSIDHCLAGLKPIRHYRGLSLADAASLIGVEATSYARFEVLADALGCSLDDLRTYRTEDELAAHLGPNRFVKPERAAPVPPPPPAEEGTVVEAALEGWGVDQ